MTIQQKLVIKRAIIALDDALFRFQQHNFDLNADWLEEIRLSSLALEDLLESSK